MENFVGILQLMGHPEVSFETPFSLLKLLSINPVTFIHVFGRTIPYSSKWATCLLTIGNYLPLIIVNIHSQYINSYSLSPPSRPLADSFLLGGTEIAEDVFTPMCYSCLHQTGEWLACCKGKGACLFALWLSDRLLGSHCILKTEASGK